MDQDRMTVSIQDNYTTFTVSERQIKKLQDMPSLRAHPLGRIEVKHENGKSSFIHMRLGVDDKGRVMAELACNRGDGIPMLRKHLTVALRNQVDTRPKTQQTLLEN
jgi:hypothetical protein